jgi:hypothetical protein
MVILLEGCQKLEGSSYPKRELSIDMISLKRLGSVFAYKNHFNTGMLRELVLATAEDWLRCIEKRCFF